MKRKQFVQQLARDGCVFLRAGGRHDLYLNPRNNRKQPVPRHTEIDDNLARHIRKQLGLN